MTKSKEKYHIGRTELADRLRKVADMVESGNLRVGDVGTEIPDELQYELELEEDMREGKLEIELEWNRHPNR
ncbi:MAG: amphi-Trp domain-containing protein [Armatimonadota bacterium]